MPLALSAFLEMEDQAQIIYTYCPMQVPALLQTPAYALSAALAGLPAGATYEQAAGAAELVAVRQRVLDRHQGPHLWAVLDRAALSDPPLGRTEDRLAQLDALTKAARQPHLAVQVARPVSESGYLYQGPPFTLLRFPSRSGRTRWCCTCCTPRSSSRTGGGSRSTSRRSRGCRCRRCPWSPPPTCSTGSAPRCRTDRSVVLAELPGAAHVVDHDAFGRLRVARLQCRQDAFVRLQLRLDLRLVQPQ
ncbi:Scr1 family TA system antitoxin-like transcriptional regulator [Nonomuraea thailandensis]